MSAAMPRQSGGTVRKVGRALARVLAVAVLSVAAWLAGLVWFAESIPREFHDDNVQTDAIIVLTGGPLRLKAGLTMLAEGRAKKLFVSGVYRTVDVTDLLRVARQTPNPVECCIVLGHAADNTAGNAAETRDWMRREGYTSLRLVTANYHLKRSLLEFRRAMPEATIVAHPVFPENYKREDWWRWPGTLSLTATEFQKYLTALARPWLGESDLALEAEP